MLHCQKKQKLSKIVCIFFVL